MDSNRGSRPRARVQPEGRGRRRGQEIFGGRGVCEGPREVQWARWGCIWVVPAFQVDLSSKGKVPTCPNHLTEVTGAPAVSIVSAFQRFRSTSAVAVPPARRICAVPYISRPFLPHPPIIGPAAGIFMCLPSFIRTSTFDINSYEHVHIFTPRRRWRSHLYNPLQPSISAVQPYGHKPHASLICIRSRLLLRLSFLALAPPI